MSTSQEPRISVVGSAVMDLLTKITRLPKLGETVFGHSFHLGFGGKGANQAVMAAQLGAQVSMVTKLGRDTFGTMTLDNFRLRGIDIRYVFVDENLSTGVAPIFVDAEANNMIVIVPGANNGLRPPDLMKAADAVRSADALICQMEIPIETTIAALTLAKEHGVRTVFNPAPAAALPSHVLAAVDVLVVNETECEVVAGIAASSLEDGLRAKQQLQQASFAGDLVITLGARGVLVLGKGLTEAIAPIPVEAVDPTGAGDAFVGSLAYFLAKGASLKEAAERANVVAGLSVMRVGTQVSFPSRAEVDEALVRHGLILGSK